MISVSYRVLSLRTSRTMMSRALMSWRAATAVFSILLRRIRGRAIKMIEVNIVQNRRGKQTTRALAPRSTARELRPDGAGRDGLRRHGHAHDRSGERAFQPRDVGGESPLPVHAKRLEKSFAG